MAVEAYYAVQLNEDDPTLTLVIGHFTGDDNDLKNGKNALFRYRPYDAKMNELIFNGTNIEYLNQINTGNKEEYAIMIDGIVKRNLKTLSRKYPNMSQKIYASRYANNIEVANG